MSRAAPFVDRLAAPPAAIALFVVTATNGAFGGRPLSYHPRARLTFLTTILGFGLVGVASG